MEARVRGHRSVQMPKGPVMQESRNSEKTAEAPVLRVLWNGSRQNQGSAEKRKGLNRPEIESPKEGKNDASSR